MLPLQQKTINGSSTANTTILAKLLPTADFKANVTKGNAPLYVQFSDLSLNAESRSWDFTSDGTVDSSDLNPAYTYSTSGTYNVTLTVSNANGTASKNTTITVVQATSLPPVAVVVAAVVVVVEPVKLLPQK